ncbi:hypothetical protein JT06_17915, partial [Desulfobulbus sp. Tol-SR]
RTLLGLPVSSNTALAKVLAASETIFDAPVLEMLQAAKTGTPATVAQTTAMNVEDAAKAIYSKLDQVASTAFTGMKAQGVLNFLSKQGVKKAEIEAVGLGEWLAGMKPTDKVTRDDLTGFVRANMVETEDVVLSEESEKRAWFITYTDGSALAGPFQSEEEAIGEAEESYPDRDDIDIQFKKGGEVQFKSYTEPNADPGSYREMFVTAPSKKVDGRTFKELEAAQLKIINDNKKNGVDVWALSADHPTRIELSRLSGLAESKWHNDREGIKGEWQDGHSQYSEISNPVVRIRFNTETRDGKIYLRIEEMQGPSGDQWFTVGGQKFDQRSQATKYADEHGINYTEIKKHLDGNQAKMPSYLQENIYNLGVKRIIAYAKEQGFDGITFATKPGRTAGETQADRYDLRKQVDTIAVTRTGDGAAYMVKAYKGATPVLEKTANNISEVEGFVGKNAARKAEGLAPGRTAKIQGEDLAIGGEGLKQLYDNQLPKMFEAYSKEKMVDGVLPITGKVPESFPLFYQGSVESQMVSALN